MFNGHLLRGWRTRAYLYWTSSCPAQCLLKPETSDDKEGLLQHQLQDHSLYNLYTVSPKSTSDLGKLALLDDLELELIHFVLRAAGFGRVRGKSGVSCVRRSEAFGFAAGV